MEFSDEADIDRSLRLIEQVVASGIFNPANGNSPFFQPSFIAVLISLRDLMFKVEKYSSRIDFSDDVTQLGNVKDVSGLIKFVRDALCHPDSDNHYLENGVKATFNVVFGAGCIADYGDYRQESLYEDDICFFFGRHRIYLRRHIVRAFEEASEKLSPMLNFGRGRY
ncbi:hypothetical protein [Pseudomonas viridiflava]|uniref:hypothetical protein n=1 Tax=Pseudomonas viridiflava TaxID=33069 RepID=UPI000F02C802|nr:hypothetical protein [Pseudomonas viridiflava]